jgi:hypothetical protein
MAPRVAEQREWAAAGWVEPQKGSNRRGNEKGKAKGKGKAAKGGRKSKWQEENANPWQEGWQGAYHRRSCHPF